MRPARRTAVIVAAVVAAAALLAVAWWLFLRDDSPTPEASPTVTSSAPSPTPTSTPSMPVTPEPEPTEQPPATTAPEQPSTPEQPGTVTVDVVTTYAGWNALSSALEAGAYATVVEADGVCTLTATQGPTVVSAQSAAVPDASTTSCGGLALGGDQLSSGSWQVVVSYASPTSAGSAAPLTVEIP